MVSSPSSSDHPATSDHLPLREIPGDYGLPFFGPIKDRYDYFYNQGKDDFFKTRIIKYNSTVFRTNMPPGPFISNNPKVVAVLDSKSFPILFDNEKVEKRNILDGTYMPSTSFFGGYRVCAFLDTSESSHHALKSLFLSFLASSHKKFIPYLRTGLSELFANLESEIADKKSADFNEISDNMAFDFVFRLVTGVLPSETKVKSKGPGTITTWLALQLAPLGTAGLKFVPNFIDDIIHTLYNAVYDSATSLLDEAEKSGIKREEACHNLVFLIGFNAFGGMKVLYPSLIKWIGSGGATLHRRLAEEIRAAVKEAEGDVTLTAIENMPLTKSVVYETLRIDPPVPFQYAKAREDIVVESHDSKFQIKKGEVIFGYQPLATKDPKVFENPEEFVADRFVGEEGEKLLRYVYWSNARETNAPSADNKQCPARDLVVLLSRLLVVELFLRYKALDSVLWFHAEHVAWASGFAWAVLLVAWACDAGSVYRTFIGDTLIRQVSWGQWMVLNFEVKEVELLLHGSNIIEIVADHGIVFALAQSGVCAFNRVKVIVPNMMALDRCIKIRKGQPDAGFALLTSGSFKWPGFVEFDDVNGNVLTFSRHKIAGPEGIRHPNTLPFGAPPPHRYHGHHGEGYSLFINCRGHTLKEYEADLEDNGSYFHSAYERWA
ncbi:hypothetical protein OSB04_030519 [Centaurea solstitialis]|uniref:Allene oxide synthase n=1 Tax=Centaurea solstitialis TaxID=347529 RepID=A0AA38W786_9ASTR|nr:hypothetical protein OSB04_030519 [Centaurea solstitialis]